MLQSQNRFLHDPITPTVDQNLTITSKSDNIHPPTSDLNRLFSDQSVPQQERKVVLKGIDPSLLLPIIQSAWKNGWAVSIFRNDISNHLFLHFFSQFRASMLISAPNDRAQKTICPQQSFTFPVSGLQKKPSQTGQSYSWQENQCAAVLFTSGSTGTPKGVCHSRGNLLRSAELFAYHFDLQPHDRLYCLALPHSMSGFRSLLLPLVAQTQVTMNQTRNDTFLSIIQNIPVCRPTKILCGPFFVHLLAAYGKRLREYMQGVDTLFCTGAELNLNDRDEVENIFDIQVLNFYGLTETGGMVLGEKPGHRTQTNLPPPCANVEVRIKPAIDCPQSSELHIGSDNIFLGYLDEALVRRSSLNTRDLVARTSNNELRFIGRGTNAVKAPSTEWIFPGLLESWLREKDFFTDVVVKTIPIPGGHGLEVFMDPRGSFSQFEIEKAINEKFGPDYRPFHWQESDITRNWLGKIQDIKTRTIESL